MPSVGGKVGKKMDQELDRLKKIERSLKNIRLTVIISGVSIIFLGIGGIALSCKIQTILDMLAILLSL